MEVLYSCCCGLDVHAKTVVACLIKLGKKDIRTFGTMTEDLLTLSDWLVAEGCTHVAMESTGVYWRPIFNILESVVQVMLVNAYHIKTVPGRKTDVRDCEWIADLLRHGLLKPSFIPPLQIRELRELTRYRSTLVQEQSRVANRIQKVAESGNIKLSQVASDALGVSGRSMLQALAAGQTDAQAMAMMAKKRLKDKTGELTRALEGRLTDVQRWVLGELLEQYEVLKRSIERTNNRIDEEVVRSPDPFVAEALAIADEIPGIGVNIAQDIIAEIGINMSAFPSPRHIASWAGLSPGNNESAGKRRRSKTPKGSPYLRRALVQAAWAATRTKNSYLSAQYRRLYTRLGPKKAIVAVAHSILIIIYKMLSRHQHFADLGANYFDHRNSDALRRSLLRKLQNLGLKVTVIETTKAA